MTHKSSLSNAIAILILPFFVLGGYPCKVRSDHLAAITVNLALEADSLQSALPAVVLHLSEWPDATIFNGPKRLSGNDPIGTYPKQNSVRWIKKAIDGNWLPSEEIPTILIRQEFDGRDVVRSKWKTINGFDIEVSQTASLFVLKVIPSNTALATGAIDRPKARVLFQDVLAKIGERRTGQGIPVRIDNLSHKIGRFSVDEARIKQLKEGIIIGVAKDMKTAGVSLPKDDLAAGEEQSPTNQNWENTAEAYHYWFRQIHWWTDGKQLAMFFMKTENGTWLPNYSGDIDINWFSEPRDRLGKPLK